MGSDDTLSIESESVLSYSKLQGSQVNKMGPNDTFSIEYESCGLCFEENNKLSECEHIERKSETENKECIDIKQPAKPSSSFTHSVINMTGMVIGLGQLSTSYGLENGGWVSAFLLVGLGMICAYSACLLGKCLDKNPELRSYTDIGQQAFGTKGKIIATILIYTDVFMGLVSYTISLHDNLNMVIKGIPIKVPLIKKSKLLTTTAILVTLPSLWLRDFTSIAFLSAGGIIMSMLIFLTVTGTAIFGVVNANHNIPVLHLNKIPHVTGLYAYSYAGHTVFPNIYTSMKDPSKYPKVTVLSFTTITALYTALAFMGAKMFGPNINSQITLSMPQDSIATKIALWATVLTPMTKYALKFAPLAIQLEHNLPSFTSSRTRKIIRGSIGSILLIAILALALSVPYFQYVLNLTGSLISVSISIIIPCIFYSKIHLAEISKPHLLFNGIIIMIGFVISLTGTMSSSKSLIKKITTATPSG
ncbi:amino acid transporter AVT1H-like [Chenopodium quinoa]|uniref:amino acid transporter AVT1H-like n=1 Tax=Chenopodium quinoa TaxID=63459 RepID=UPI000B778E2E|nr:amino acid transporter AVT1H-like [Chenopodium quinoa]